MKIVLIIVLQLIMFDCEAQKEIKMESNLLTGRILDTENAKKIVIFGGSPFRRNEIVELLLPIENLSIYATLSEEEGMAKIIELGQVDIVLIGGRYSDEQRSRIRKYVQDNLPNAKITEPGYTYVYSNTEILRQVKILVSNK